MKDQIGSFEDMGTKPVVSGESPALLENETYTEYQRRVFTDHSLESSIGVISYAYEDDETVVQLENLWSGTEYQV